MDQRNENICLSSQHNQPTSKTSKAIPCVSQGIYTVIISSILIGIIYFIATQHVIVMIVVTLLFFILFTCIKNGSSRSTKHPCPPAIVAATSNAEIMAATYQNNHRQSNRCLRRYQNHGRCPPKQSSLSPLMSKSWPLPSDAIDAGIMAAR